MSSNSGRITSLNRYISFLRQEEKRNKWITTTTSPTNVENIDAVASLSTIFQKLIGAERELSDLEFGQKR